MNEPHGTVGDPTTVYQERRDRFAEARGREAARADRVSRARVAAFVGAFSLLVAAEVDAFDAGGAWTAIAAVLAIVFIGLVVRHRRIGRAERWFDDLRRINDEAIRRRDRDWEQLPLLPVRGPGADHAYADDLDVFGHASLSHLLGPVGTARGRTRLADWLVAPAAPVVVAERQAAVSALAPRIDLRDEIAGRAHRTRDDEPDDIDEFLAWAEDRPWLRSRPALLWTVRVLPVALVALGALRIAGVVAGHWWVLPFAVGLGLSRRWRDRIGDTLSRAFAREGVFHEYPALFRLIADADVDAPRLAHLREELTGDGVRADRAMRRLERTMALAEVRYSSFHGVIHALTLWDFHVVARLEGWQRAAGARARRWFDALAEVEALAAFARLAHAEPDWAYPTIARDDSAEVRARQLAHPLLAPDERVANDVAVGPPGTFLFVTGSNMSGKSTLLRSIGTNVVLAQAGSPVCATDLRLPPTVLHTSIRVQDSLEQGVSVFLAELQRLRQIVDGARAVRDDDRRTALYLIDEMLHGTNAEERRIAARRILRHLLDLGAIGVVTTHDLTLVDTPELESARREVHFTETMTDVDGRTVMRFDYRLRPGLATSRNALELMRAIGLDLEAY